ncbi:hypothetical protein QFC19_004467 [Naganishia cerealis]|uniref:Uncharacterized protein n=1 Tax=Naganishia cerealis TaxID=610337 RepID=A0ACC2VW46_9TREE|nr:hypothetical protein QFC19_004467 [Naganishia cerealis]
MGVFVNKDGDPVRGTMNWDSHPRSIGIDEPPQRLSLASNATEQSSGSHAILSGISINPYGLMVPNPKRDKLLQPVHRKPMSGSNRKGHTDAVNITGKETVNSPTSDEGRRGSDASMFAPSATLEPASVSCSNPGLMHKLPGFPPSVTINETLIWTSDTVYVLTSDSWVIKANAILSEGTQDASDKAAKMVEEERKKAKRGEVDGDRAGHTAELRFLYARLAYTRLRAALFDDAGSLFQKSKIDPRFVICLFPKYVGDSIHQEQEVAIWHGLVHDLDETSTIDDIGK